MSWFSAKSSASQLAERLKKFERKAPEAASAAPALPVPAAPPPVYVKPTRIMQPHPEEVARAITAELADADLIEDERPRAADEEQLHQQSAADAEGRRAPRKPQALPAYITAPGMSNIIPSRVIDMSATGAKIELTPMGRSTGIPLGYLPDRFVLVLRHDRMEVDCEIVWQEEWFLGLRFLGFPRPMQDKR